MKNILLAYIFFMLFSACENREFFELERPVESPWTKLEEFDRAVIGPSQKIFATNNWGNVYNYWYLFRN
ncbi:MAG: hypothetical protein AAGU19_18590, partial [Prolixibacteraceae bacterium]